MKTPFFIRVSTRESIVAHLNCAKTLKAFGRDVGAVKRIVAMSLSRSADVNVHTAWILQKMILDPFLSTSLLLQMYKSGVYVEPACTDKVTHAMLLVGYGSEGGSDYWIIKNRYGGMSQGNAGVNKGSVWRLPNQSLRLLISLPQCHWSNQHSDV